MLNSASAHPAFFDVARYWSDFQLLPIEQQILVVLFLISALFAFLKFVPEKVIEVWSIRSEHQRLDRQEQAAVAARQAEWKLNPNPTYGYLLTVGSSMGFFRVGGSVQNVGLATARLRNIQLFMDGHELPWDLGSAPRQGNVEIDVYVEFEFRVPFRLEDAGLREEWKGNSLIDGHVFRFVVTYADGTGEREPFVRCFSFEPSEQFHRWNCIEIDPCP